MAFVTGAARVTFSSQASFISAVSARFVQIIYGDVDKRVSEVLIVDSVMMFAPIIPINLLCYLLKFRWR